MKTGWWDEKKKNNWAVELRIALQQLVTNSWNRLLENGPSLLIMCYQSHIPIPKKKLDLTVN